MKQPELNFAIICDNAFIDQGNRLSIIQTFSEVKANKFPAIQPRLVVVTNFKSEKRDESVQIKHVVSLLSPEDRLLGKVQIDRDGVEEETQFISYFNGLPLEKEGTYKIQIILNSKLYSKLEFQVKQE